MTDTGANDTIEPGARLGEFRLLSRVGGGGMGVVYRARSEATGVEVALKVVSTTSQGALQGIRREIQTLRRIAHPGIVRIVGEGERDGVPWYAMELIDGVSLQGHARTDASMALLAAMGAEPATTPMGSDATQLLSGSGAGTTTSVRPAPPLTPERLQRVLTVVRRLCHPLAYLHGEGIVHRDLKPGNVMVRANGYPVIVDFGLASRYAVAESGESLEHSGLAAGTVAYMAPEQVRGELVDARADLYGLGCILHELLAGRPPFVGSVEEVLWQQMNRPPEPLSQAVEGLPPGVERLVLRLLAKAPASRFGYATDVAQALAELGAEEGWEATAPPGRAYLYRSRFAGRQPALAELASGVARAAGGSGGLVLLGGGSGMGKTRLLMEAASQAAARGYEVLLGEASPGGAPLATLRAALQSIGDRCREEGLAQTERILGRRGAVLAPYLSSLEGLPGQSGHAAPATLQGDAGRIRLWSYLTETLREATAGRPTLLALDDLQWTDELTLGWLRFVARGQQLSRMSLLVVASYRSDEAGPELAALQEGEGVSLLRLDRMDPEQIGAIVGDMLALEATPHELVELLSRHTEGNPFFVVEYLRSAISQGLMHRDDEGRWRVGPRGGSSLEASRFDELALPGSLQRLVERRLGALGQAARTLLEAASVWGREIPTALAGSVAGVTDEVAREGVQELLARQVMEEEGSSLRFEHDKVRRVGYDGLSADLRRTLHRRAAEVMASSEPGDREEAVAEEGRHWELGGEAVPACRCYLAAARRAHQRFANDESERLFRCYLRLADGPTAERVDATMELAERIVHRSGRPREAEELLRTALADARALHDTSRETASLRALGAVHHDTGRFAEARELFDEALAIARAREDLVTEAKLLGHLGNMDRELGSTASAGERYERALAIAQHTGERLLEGMCYGHLSNLRRVEGHHDEAWALLDRALSIAREMGDRRGEGIMLGNLAIQHHVEGNLEEAARLYREALAIQREVGDRRFEGIQLGNLAMLGNEMGRLDEAADLYERAAALAREIGDLRAECIWLGLLGRVHGELGRPARARACCERALDAARRTGDRTLEATWLILLGTLSGCEGQLGMARGCYERVFSVTDDVERHSEALAQLLVLATFDGGEAHEDRLAGIETALAERGARFEVARLLATRCRLALAGEGDAAALLERARSHAPAASRELTLLLDALQRALEQRAAGGSLVNGFLREELSPAQLAWIETHRPDLLGGSAPPADRPRI